VYFCILQGPPHKQLLVGVGVIKWSLWSCHHYSGRCGVVSDEVAGLGVFRAYLMGTLLPGLHNPQCVAHGERTTRISALHRVHPASSCSWGWVLLSNCHGPVIVAVAGVGWLVMRWWGWGRFVLTSWVPCYPGSMGSLNPKQPPHIPFGRGGEGGHGDGDGCHGEGEGRQPT
jgi:hypothetical protein